MHSSKENQYNKEIEQDIENAYLDSQQNIEDDNCHRSWSKIIIFLPVLIILAPVILICRLFDTIRRSITRK